MTQHLPLLAALLGIGGMFFASLYGVIAVRYRILTRRDRRQRAAIAARDTVIAGLKTDLLAGAARILELESVATKMEAELHRVDRIRKRTEDGCAAKHDELELARQHIQALVEHVEV